VGASPVAPADPAVAQSGFSRQRRWVRVADVGLVRGLEWRCSWYRLGVLASIRSSMRVGWQRGFESLLLRQRRGFQRCTRSLPESRLGPAVRRRTTRRERGPRGAHPFRRGRKRDGSARSGARGAAPIAPPTENARAAPPGVTGSVPEFGAGPVGWASPIPSRVGTNPRPTPTQKMTPRPMLSAHGAWSHQRGDPAEATSGRTPPQPTAAGVPQRAPPLRR
jgi:hypothetical protein